MLDSVNSQVFHGGERKEKKKKRTKSNQPEKLQIKLLELENLHY